MKDSGTERQQEENGILEEKYIWSLDSGKKREAFQRRLISVSLTFWTIGWVISLS